MQCTVFKIEAWAGIAPAYIPFAEECLTTWLPGRLQVNAPVPIEWMYFIPVSAL